MLACKSQGNITGLKLWFLLKKNLNQASINIGNNIQSRVDLRKQVRVILLSWQLERMTNGYRY